MKIISKAKDYYDYVGKLYGEDDKVIYNRLDIKVKEYHPVVIPNPFKKNNQELHLMHGHVDGLDIHQLIVCGYVFTVEKPRYTEGAVHYKALSPENLIKLRDRSNRSSYYFLDEKEHYYTGEFSEQAKTLCKILEQPVIVYTGQVGNDELGFSPRIPNLGEAGVSLKFSPEQMFQMIHQFISNEIRENPDIKPPVEVEDKYKIIGHGFDLKTSFRHRKES